MSLFSQIQKILQFEKVYEGLTPDNTIKPAQGWTTAYYPEAVKEFLLTKSHPVVIVEVGTWLGASAIQVADIVRDLGRQDIILCVDTWLGSPEHFLGMPKKNGFPQIYSQFLQNIVNHGHTNRVLPIPLPSLQAIDILRPLLRSLGGADLIYIDAAHEYMPVYMDIKTYWPLLKAGGRMLGDDFTDNWPGVKQAVNQFASEIKLPCMILNDWVWQIDKPSP
jgi:hypothetical protein